MLSDFFGFAQVPREIIPEGIMFKRQVATGISVSTALPTSDTSVVGVTSAVTSVVDSVTSDLNTSSQQTTSQASTPTSQASSPAQNTDTASSTSNVATSSNGGATTSAAPTSSASPTSFTTKTSNGVTITSPVSSPTSSATSSLVSTGSGTSSDFVFIGSSTINRSTLSSAMTITTPLVTSSTMTSSYTSFWTADGSVQSRVVTTDMVVSSTTGFATATILPELQSGGSGSSGSGLSPSSQKVVGGVVGGIGGAILLGGIAIVAWRLWGKKKRHQLDDDYYGAPDSADGSLRQEKVGRANTMSSNGASSPFSAGAQAAAPSYGGDTPYRNMNTQVNTASNF